MKKDAKFFNSFKKSPAMAASENRLIDAFSLLVELKAAKESADLANYSYGGEFDPKVIRRPFNNIPIVVAAGETVLASGDYVFGENGYFVVQVKDMKMSPQLWGGWPETIRHMCQEEVKEQFNGTVPSEEDWERQRQRAQQLRDEVNAQLLAAETAVEQFKAEHNLSELYLNSQGYVYAARDGSPCLI